ncbi:MAG: AmmeMemoRadiSam system radical SAM enzyme [Deltaproteobacteria bacterium]|nr:AmmeMemoRadiSam system radical SAM enzyme [Deltaproteobacteria bacterium]
MEGPSVLSWVSRRDFLGRCIRWSAFFALSGTALAGPWLRRAVGRVLRGKPGFTRLKVSPLFVPLEHGYVECTLCPRECRVAPGERGYCGVRENRKGKYYTLVYGNPCAVHVDPIEKKPFFHVLPGSRSFSIATAGCNFDCKFCQNWEISQATPEETVNVDLPPREVVDLAEEYGCRSIASTYVEPTIFFEYMLDVGVEARKQGILNVYHSNGYINPEPLETLMEFLDAACIDLKGFTEDYYRSMTEGTLQPVLRTLKALRRRGVHLEIVNLVIPTKNDDMDEVRRMSRWIKEELGPEVPLHFSKFYPMYKLRNLPPTPVSTLEKAREVALSVGLQYVYLGNVPGHEAENTFCPKCRKLLIRRTGYMVGEINLERGKCKYCGNPIPGIWI